MDSVDLHDALMLWWVFMRLSQQLAVLKGSRCQTYRARALWASIPSSCLSWRNSICYRSPISTWTAETLEVIRGIGMCSCLSWWLHWWCYMFCVQSVTLSFSFQLIIYTCDDPRVCNQHVPWHIDVVPQGRSTGRELVVCSGNRNWCEFSLHNFGFALS